MQKNASTTPAAPAAAVRARNSSEGTTQAGRARKVGLRAVENHGGAHTRRENGVQCKKPCTPDAARTEILRRRAPPSPRDCATTQSSLSHHVGKIGRKERGTRNQKKGKKEGLECSSGRVFPTKNGAPHGAAAVLHRPLAHICGKYRLWPAGVARVPLPPRILFFKYLHSSALSPSLLSYWSSSLFTPTGPLVSSRLLTGWYLVTGAALMWRQLVRQLEAAGAAWCGHR